MRKATARHILVDTREEAEKIKKNIENGADFAAQAAKYSKCPSGQQGETSGNSHRVRWPGNSTRSCSAKRSKKFTAQLKRGSGSI